ncbi:MAG: DUF4145 domain-containing protein [Bacillota bacterium]
MLSASGSWQCPFCKSYATIRERDSKRWHLDLDLPSADGHHVLLIDYIVCPNDACRKFTLTAMMAKVGSADDPRKWKLVPQPDAAPLPDYVPQAVREDYLEAHAIKELSPKAAATLARRCLQGIIRDFWEVSRDRLIDEIRAIQDKVDPLTWQAIDAVRKVGNIGAHMEKDVNLIIDVEPHEAEQLLALVEMLVRDWYVARHERQRMLSAIVEMAESKEAARKKLFDTQAEGQSGDAVG